ncbi:MAG: radical SAM protein [Deltaproteobacteria bacterium]|nr:radical SAM protein [Deltaproteobacteria bacterium]
MRNLALTGFRYWRADRKLGLPLQVGFAVNNSCNTFCEMCNIWKVKPKRKLSIDQMRQVFGHRLFRHCITISLTGGEPTLRNDFSQIPVALADVMPSLSQINLTSNGFSTDKIVADLESFLPELRSRGVGFSVNLSMDGVGEVHNSIRGNDRAFERLEQTVERLQDLRRRLPFHLVLATTLTRNNLSDAMNVLGWAKERDLYVIFRNASAINRTHNSDDFESFALQPKEMEAAQSFYQHLLEKYDRSRARSTYYRMLLEMMQGARRSIPCLYRKAGLFVDHRGDMYVCTVHSRKVGNALEEDPEEVFFGSADHRTELACGDCRKCSHDVSLFLSPLSQVVDRARSMLTQIRR